MHELLVSPLAQNTFPDPGGELVGKAAAPAEHAFEQVGIIRGLRAKDRQGGGGRGV